MDARWTQLGEGSIFKLHTQLEIRVLYHTTNDLARTRVFDLLLESIMNIHNKMIIARYWGTT